MYQAIYKCRLCGEEFAKNWEWKMEKMKGIDFKNGIAIDEELNIYSFSNSNSHHCKDDSFGFADFQGFKKVEE